MPDHKCSKCSKSGVRLWRGYNECAPELLCTTCATAVEKAGHKPGWQSEYELGMPGMTIGWHVPAVPILLGGDLPGFVGYGNLTDKVIAPWVALPE